MVDREKVIKAIETHISTDDSVGCNNCTYENDGWCLSKVLIDDLALLKEQKPVAPVLVGRMWECGKCYAPVGIIMDDQRDLFCRTCGTKVKWDG